MRSAEYMIALGGDVRLAAQELVDAPEGGLREVPRDAFIEFCGRVEKLAEEDIVDRFGLSPGDAETLVPALLVYRALLLETSAQGITVPPASLRDGLLADMAASTAASTARQPRGLRPAGAGQRRGAGREVPLRRRARAGGGPPRRAGCSTN